MRIKSDRRAIWNGADGLSSLSALDSEQLQHEQIINRFPSLPMLYSYQVSSDHLLIHSDDDIAHQSLFGSGTCTGNEIRRGYGYGSSSSGGGGGSDFDLNFNFDFDSVVQLDADASSPSGDASPSTSVFYDIQPDISVTDPSLTNISDPSLTNTDYYDLQTDVILEDFNNTKIGRAADYRSNNDMYLARHHQC